MLLTVLVKQVIITLMANEQENTVELEFRKNMISMLMNVHLLHSLNILKLLLNQLNNLQVNCLTVTRIHELNKILEKITLG